MNRVLFFLFCLVLALNSDAQIFELDTIRWSGSIEKRINLVILGDGYQSHELDKFDQDARNFNTAIFNQTPFREYATYFNVVSIRVPSNVSGAAADPSALIDNYFGSTFNFAGIDRLLVPTRTAAVLSVLGSNFPAYDQVVVLVNDSKYGGSGGWLATSSTHSSANEIAIHEIGHSFANLADEYYAGDQFARERPNMSRETNPDLVRWKNWIGTMGVGVFQHCCGGNSALWYKPHNNCKMQSLNRPFCRVCIETFVRTIHDLTQAIQDYSPKEEIVAFESEPILFSLDLLHPMPNTLQRLWILEDQLIASQTDTLFLSPDSLGTFSLLEAWVVDTSSFLRIDDFALAYSELVYWDLENIQSNIQITESQSSRHTWKLYPIPASEELFLEADRLPADCSIQLYSRSGFLRKNIQVTGSTSPVRIDMSDLKQAEDTYLILHISSNNKTLKTFQVPRSFKQ